MKKIIIAAFSAIFLAGCGFAGFPVSTGGDLIENEQMLIYLPAQYEKQKSKLILIVPTGNEKQLINIWKNYANRYNYILAVSKNWTHDKLLKDLKNLQAEYQPRQTFITGFSNGGYNSCHLGLRYPELITGIIPMGAFCDEIDVDKSKLPQAQKTPILVVVGELDTWARGDDLKMIDKATEKLNKLNIKQEQIIVPKIGHSYPNQALGRVVDWINKK